MWGTWWGTWWGLDWRTRAGRRGGEMAGWEDIEAVGGHRTGVARTQEDRQERIQTWDTCRTIMIMIMMMMMMIMMMIRDLHVLCERDSRDQVRAVRAPSLNWGLKLLFETKHDPAHTWSGLLRSTVRVQLPLTSYIVCSLTVSNRWFPGWVRSEVCQEFLQ